MRTLPEQLLNADQAAVPVRLTYGIVTSTSPLMLLVGGSTVASPAKKLRGASFVTGEKVAVLVSGADRVVLGALE